MSDIPNYLEKRGISEEEMEAARARTRAYIDAYSLKQARKQSNMTQAQLAEAIGVSQNRKSRMEHGEVGTMSVDVLRRYIEAVGGRLTLVADLPSGKAILI